MKINQLDKTFLGLLSGILAPMFAFCIIFLIKYAEEYTFTEMIEKIQTLGLGAKVVALSVFVANLSLYYIMYRLRWDRFCKGVLLATFLYAILVIFMKYQ